MNRVDIAKRFVSFWMEECLSELRRDAGLHAHMLDLIARIKSQFEAEMFSVTTEARMGLEPVEL